jgi:hypothetical protein
VKSHANALTPPFWRAFTVPKSDATPDENEDAFAANPARGLFALADGATQSGFAGQWARLLVEGFTTTDNRSGDWLASHRKAWADSVDKIEVPWYVAERREKGAYAAFLGLSLSLAAGRKIGQWSAVAVGDVCAFQFRNGILKLAWPLERSNQFGNLPKLIGSRQSDDYSQAEVKEGAWKGGDYFFLMTDALSCWFLSRMETTRSPWNWLRHLTESADAEEQYEKTVTRLRKDGDIKDDDTTLMAIRV